MTNNRGSKSKFTKAFTKEVTKASGPEILSSRSEVFRKGS
jgi:hypothetical protein